MVQDFIALRCHPSLYTFTSMTRWSKVPNLPENFHERCAAVTLLYWHQLHLNTFQIFGQQFLLGISRHSVEHAHGACGGAQTLW